MRIYFHKVHSLQLYIVATLNERITPSSLFALHFYGVGILRGHAEKVKSVEDGNTMTIVLNDRPVPLKLAHIDAPEKKQAYGDASRKSLADLCLGKNAVLQNKQLDYSGTLVAVVQCDGSEVNRMQVERGLAWVDPKHNNDLSLPALEAMARRDRRGLWTDNDPLPPWKFRRPARKAKLAHVRHSDDAICFVDKWGSYRIVDGDRRYGC